MQRGVVFYTEKANLFKRGVGMSEVLVANFGTIAGMLCLPFLVGFVRRVPSVHEKVFLLGARYGRVFFPLCGLAILFSGIVWYRSSPYFEAHQYAMALGLHGFATVCVTAVGVLRRYDAENAALTWRSAVEASVHLTSPRLNSDSAPRFLSQMPVVWVRARKLGFERLRLLSPLLVDESRRERLAAALVAQANAAGHPCKASFIESHAWNPVHSAYYYVRWGRRSNPAAINRDWFKRVFRVRVGGIVLVAQR
jgi:hypothetical protein